MRQPGGKAISQRDSVCIHPHPPTLSRQHARRTLAGSPTPCHAFPEVRTNRTCWFFFTPPPFRCPKTKQVSWSDRTSRTGAPQERACRWELAPTARPRGTPRRRGGVECRRLLWLCEAVCFAPLTLCGSEVAQSCPQPLLHLQSRYLRIRSARPLGHLPHAPIFISLSLGSTRP